MPKLTVDLDAGEHRALKLLAMRRGTSMSRIMRDLIADELAEVPESDRVTAESWTLGAVRAVLGITGEPTATIREEVAAAMAVAEHEAEGIYGMAETGQP
jgi:hypothetical protein